MRTTLCAIPASVAAVVPVPFPPRVVVSLGANAPVSPLPAAIR